jgi:ABC-type nitrate/sulfonate/bicarbonate transport system ATPase subunit
MSGGQKYRIQLATTVYIDANIYLLDKAFSVVHAQTATTLF